MEILNMEIFRADTRRDPKKPDLHPLPSEPPEDPTHHGWTRGLRDWYWSEIRQELHVFTGGAASYTDRYYPLGVSALEVIGKRARFLGLGVPSDEASAGNPPGEALEWLEAGLRAASFSIGGDSTGDNSAGGGELLFQGPDGLPDFFLEKALGFAVRRANRALEMYGEETDSASREVSGPGVSSKETEPAEEPSETPRETTTEPKSGEEPGGEALPGDYEQGSLF